MCSAGRQSTVDATNDTMLEVSVFSVVLFIVI